MMPLYPFLFLFNTFVFTQNKQLPEQTLPSVTREEGNIDDVIIEVFNRCKCVIFYHCDEENFIIPQDELVNTRVTLNNSLRSLKRLRCSNEFYYCCKDRNKSSPATSTSTIASTTVISSYMPSILRPHSEMCGIQNSSSRRVIDHFPWTVAIYKKIKADNTYTFQCAGSLIHSRVVMTQRKCAHFAPDELGVTSRREFLTQNTTPNLSVSKTIKHELYYSGGKYNDIGLIVLESPIANLRPVCLPTHNQNFDGKRCIAVGWSGRTKSRVRLREVNLPLVEAQSCQKLLRNTTLSPDFQMHSSLLCAGGEEGKGSCKDDGGGPLMCEENGSYIQVGIVSWGVECSKKDVPSLYTNVASLVPWIEQKLIAENL